MHKTLKVLISCALALGLYGCGIARDKLRADASIATGCPQERIQILEYGTGVARIDACGETLVCYRRDDGSALRSGSTAALGLDGVWECKG